MHARNVVSTAVFVSLVALVLGAPARGACPGPGEAEELAFAADGQTLSWTAAPGNGAAILVHDLLRGTLPWSFGSPVDTVCVESNDGVDTLAVDPTLPAVGMAHYYAPRGETECGLGSLGADSTGVLRPQGIQCGACLSDATCDDGLVCNGVETCPGPGEDCRPGVPPSCGEFACSEAIGDCLTTCSDDADCATGFGCLEGACLDAIDVTSTADEPDEFPGDGVCRSASGACTLRAAVQTVNALGSFRLIRLPEGAFLLTIPGSGENRGETGDLDLLQEMAIRGVSAARTWVDAQQDDRVFHVGPDVPEVTLARLKVQRGRTSAPAGGGEPDDGGGILNEGSLRLLEVEVNACRTAGDGGGIANLGQLTLERSTVSFNEAAGDGAGIANFGRADLSASTVSSNHADGRGGGIYQDLMGGELDLGNVTIYRNGAGDGGGLYWPGGTLMMTNTALAGSISGGDCSGVPPSNGHNLASDLSCDLTGDGDLLAPPMLSELLVFGDSGIRTHYPLEGSPLDGAGDPASEPPIDQNGVNTEASPTFIGSVAKQAPELLQGSGRLYRADYYGIDIYETLLHQKVGHLDTSQAGNQLQVHPDGTRLYSLYADLLNVYNIVGDTLQWHATIQGQNLEAFDIHPSGAWLFLCGSGAEGWIHTIDTSNDVVTVGAATVPGTTKLVDCAAQSYSSGSVLATTHVSKTAAFTADDALMPLSTVPWPSPRQTHLVQRGPGGTFFTLDYEFFPDAYENRLYFISSHSAPPIPILDLPATDFPIEDITMHPDGTRLYVTLSLAPFNDELLEILPTNPAQVTGSWPDFALTMAMDPLGYRLYANGTHLTAISPYTHQIVAELPSSILRKGLAVKP